MAELRDALAAALRFSREAQLRLVHNGGLLPADARVSDCQLTPGTLLEVVRSAGDDQLLAPVLSATDKLRFVHESGRQTGYAWPVNDASAVVALDCDDVGSVALASESSQRLMVSARDDGERVEVMTSSDAFVLRLDSGASKRRVTAGPGSLVALYADAKSDEPLVTWRVLTADEHELSRRGLRAIRYRVTPEDDSTEPQDVLDFPVKPPPFGSAPELDWTLVLLENSMFLALPLFIILRTGFVWYTALFFIPAFLRPLLAVYRHRKEIGEFRKRVDEWERETNTIEAEVRVRALGEVAEIRRREPSTESLLAKAASRGPGIWQRRSDDEDFLSVLVGSGRYVTPSKARFDVSVGGLGYADPAEWRSQLEQLRYVDEAPIRVSLAAGNLAVFGPQNDLLEVSAEILLRLSLQHSPSTLAMAAFMPEDARALEPLRFLRWLPHFHAMSPYFIGTRILHGAEDAEAALLSATRLTAGLESETDQQVLLIVHEAAGVRIEQLRGLLAIAAERVHLLWLGTSSWRVPEFVKQRLALPQGTSTGHLLPALREVSVLEPSGIDFDDAGAVLAPLEDEVETLISRSLPTQVELGSVLDFGQGDLGEQIAQAWNRASAVESLVAAIGRSEVDLLELDFVKQGPHMLVGGTTGSGKSELLRAMVLSLATRYSPFELAFIFIDFKGGAALHQLRGLPHAAGCVTNLKLADVRRLVLFLNAEIARRQKILRDHQGEYARYRRAVPDEILPRLLVVIDEFAGFAGVRGLDTDAIVNIAARGRSLGIHLVLATQRPQGVVDDAIKANVNARLCLRTLDERDSLSVIDAPSAAHIPGSLPGRCFARLDTGELIQFQSAWTASRSIMVAAARSGVVAEDFDPLCQPRRVGTSPDGGPRQEEDALLVLSGIPSLAASDLRRIRGGQPELRDALDQLPNLILDGSAPLAGPPAAALFAVGLADIPEEQTQRNEVIDLSRGAILFSGATQSGKTMALLSAASQFRTVFPGSEIVAIDGGGGELSQGLGEAASFVALADRPDQAAHLLDQFAHYTRARGSRPVLLLIDRVDEVVRGFGSVAAFGDFVHLVSTSPARGGFIVATADPRVEINADLVRAFTRRYAFATEPGMAATPEERVIRLYLSDRKLLAPSGTERARAFGLPPQTVHAAPSRRGAIFLGTDELTHEEVFASLRSGFAIAGPPGSGRTTTLFSMARRLYEAALSEDVYARPLPYIASDALAQAEWLLDLVAELDARRSVPAVEMYLQGLWPDRGVNFLIVDGIDSLQDILPAWGDAMAAPALLEVLKRTVVARGVGLLATSELSTRSPISLGNEWGGALHVSRRNFLVLAPPPSEVVASLGFLGVGGGRDYLYERLVQPRVDRNYLPGEGTLVERTGSRRVRIVPDRAAVDLIEQSHFEAESVAW